MLSSRKRSLQTEMIKIQNHDLQGLVDDISQAAHIAQKTNDRKLITECEQFLLNEFENSMELAALADETEMEDLLSRHIDWMAANFSTVREHRNFWKLSDKTLYRVLGKVFKNAFNERIFERTVSAPYLGNISKSCEEYEKLMKKQKCVP
jgi:hypothetical protein